VSSFENETALRQLCRVSRDPPACKRRAEASACNWSRVKRARSFSTHAHTRVRARAHAGGGGGGGGGGGTGYAFD